MDKLDEIMAHKKREIASRIRPVTDRELERFAASSRRGKSFAEALSPGDHLAVIAEIKRRSPSAGAIQTGADAAEQARKYLNAGVDAMSVLTDSEFFGGSMQDLWDVSDLVSTREVSPPLLRKDFMLHPIQVVDAAEAGAAAILIIVRALDDATIADLYRSATLAGLDALFEVHNANELERALAHAPRIVGVNNRDLGTFTTDLAISEALIPEIPDDVVAVSESGIFTPEDAARAVEAGAEAVLVGEALMREEDPERLVEALQAAGA